MQTSSLKHSASITSLSPSGSFINYVTHDANFFAQNLPPSLSSRSISFRFDHVLQYLTRSNLYRIRFMPPPTLVTRDEFKDEHLASLPFCFFLWSWTSSPNTQHSQSRLREDILFPTAPTKQDAQQPHNKTRRILYVSTPDPQHWLSSHSMDTNTSADIIFTFQPGLKYTEVFGNAWCLYGIFANGFW